MIDSDREPSGLWYAGLLLWIAILIVTGTHIRTRPGEEMVVADWLVIVEVILCTLGGLIGLLLFKKTCRWGVAAWSLTTFVLAAALSSWFSPYPIKVLGYLLLLFGVSCLTLSLVQRSPDRKRIVLLERTWLWTVSFLVLKDTLFALLTPQFHSQTGITRLGMGVTHANTLSFLASLVFWLSFGQYQSRLSSIWWLPRLIFLIVVGLSRSRMSMLVLVVGGLIWIWMKISARTPRERLILRTIVLCGAIFGLFLYGWLLLSHTSPATVLFQWVNRNQDLPTLTSLTGRTEIWTIVIGKIFTPTFHFLFGYGYGMSRFVINGGSHYPEFFAFHAHNSILEALLAMGFLGGIPLLILLLYGTRWLFQFRQLQRYFSRHFSLRAGVVQAMILIHILTESSLSHKISPIFVLFIFYVLVLDQKPFLSESLSGEKDQKYCEVQQVPMIALKKPCSDFFLKVRS